MDEITVTKTVTIPEEQREYYLGLERKIQESKKAWGDVVDCANKLELIIQECPRCNDVLRKRLAKG